MALNEIHSKLITNLYRSFIFYIPESVIPGNFKKKENYKDLKPFFDQIMVVDKKGHIDHDKLNLSDLVANQSQLDANMFTLLECKETATDYQFDFLIKKYYAEVNVFVYISKWMLDHLAIDKMEFKAYFNLQYLAFKSHYEKLGEHFEMELLPKPKPNELLKQVEAIFPPLSSFEKSELKESKEKKSKPTKKPKPVLITNEEADRFLLETVFNVKFGE